MSLLPNQVDTTQEPVNKFEPLPAGNYNMQMTESEVTPTNAGTGSYLKTTFQVLDGPFAGRLVWHNYNLVNPNQIAVDIGTAELTNTARAVGFFGPLTDSAALHSLPLTVLLKIRPEQNGYKAQNEISKFSPYTGASADAPPAPVAAPAFQAPAAPAPVAQAPVAPAPVAQQPAPVAAPAAPVAPAANPAVPAWAQ